MIIYKDFLTGDELFSDAFPIKKINDHIWEVEGKTIKVKEGVDDALIGANPSTEEGGEAVEDGVITVINVVYSHQLEELPFSNKKDYTTYLKDYLKLVTKRVAEKNPEKEKEFQGTVQSYWKDTILKKFEEWQFFRPPNYEAEHQYLIPCNYRDDGVTPYFVFIRDGLEEEKC
ncbi:Translationally-controlled tumor protein [Echinococcus granulosus]|nr:Translationally-controlled tumor protein [Echinococcus granulosus]EUB56524.1 Translationally-controlled tumor protein [Echinococcus granulosus]